VAGPGAAGLIAQATSAVGGVIADAASQLGVRPTLWIMLTGLVLSSLILLLGPLRTLRDLPSHQAPNTALQPSLRTA